MEMMREKEMILMTLKLIHLMNRKHNERRLEHKERIGTSKKKYHAPSSSN
jgi:hypothetical protein